MVPSRVAGVAVGGRDLNWRGFLWQRACLGYDAKDLSLKLERDQAGCMWAWVLSGPCHLGHVVPSRVAGVVVGGRDLNWERIPLAEGLPGE